MVDEPLTLSKALRHYISASGKTLVDVEREAFINNHGGHPFMGGIGYLQAVHSGITGSQELTDIHDTDGSRLLADYLITELPRLPAPHTILIDASSSTPSTPIAAQRPIAPIIQRQRHTYKRRKRPEPK